MKRSGWLLAALLVAAAWGATGVAYPQLPERIPIHWNAQGEVDGYGTRATTFILPGLMLVLLGVFAALPWLSPRQFDPASSGGTYAAVIVLTMALLLVLHGFALWGAFDPTIDIGRGILAALFVFLGMMGPAMTRVRRNFFIGIRTPWTLASERVWDDTHRVAAWTMVASSLIGLAFVAGGLIWLSIAALVVGLLAPAGYSLVHYRRLERTGGL